jgi:transcription termination/antitermination protein NusG
MKKYYVIQVYAGYENIVKADLIKRIEEQHVQDLFGEILIPSAKMKQFFDTSDAMQDQQLFPGYILIQMEPVPEAIRSVTTTPRVLRFLGGPLSQREIDRVLAQVHGEMAVAGIKHEFEVGKEIEIKKGPFAGVVGIIENINEESEKLTVMVSFFGRMTPVELSFDEVKQ